MQQGVDLSNREPSVPHTLRISPVRRPWRRPADPKHGTTIHTTRTVRPKPAPCKICLNGLLQQLENCEDEGIEEHVLLGRKQDHTRAVVCESHGVY